MYFKWRCVFEADCSNICNAFVECLPLTQPTLGTGTCNIYIYIYNNYYYYYLVGCTIFSHLPAPIWQIYYLLPPVTSVISVFFHQSLFSHQSFNPFRPAELRSTSFSSSWWKPFHKFFWQSSFFHSLNMAIPLKLFCFNIV